MRQKKVVAPSVFVAEHGIPEFHVPGHMDQSFVLPASSLSVIWHHKTMSCCSSTVQGVFVFFQIHADTSVADNRQNPSNIAFRID
jgi:hypothetical protein